MQSNPTTIVVDGAGVEALCQSCGVCCSTFRISFYWGETTAAEGGVVPVELTEQMNLYRSCMKGSSQTKPRCIALSGNIGESVSCTIYENRPSPCRDAWVSAFEFLQMMRLRIQLDEGVAVPDLPDQPNLVNYDVLDNIDRRILKECFRVGRRLQQRIEMEHMR